MQLFSSWSLGNILILYVFAFPSQTVLRIWDCLFYEGSKILFRVALTLIHHNEALIQQAQSLPDVCQNFKQITRGPFVDECHTFMQVKVSPSLLVICIVWIHNRLDKKMDIPRDLLPWTLLLFVFPRKYSLNQGASLWQLWLNCGRRVALASSQKNLEPNRTISK